MWCLILLLLVPLAYGQDECGVAPAGLNRQFIVGGRDAPEGAWPWQLALEEFNEETLEWDFWCGAVLFDVEWAITSADCVYETFRDTFHVIAGQHNRSDTVNTQEIQIRAQDIHVHPEYNPVSPYPNDLALIRLSEPADVSRDNIGTICLPPSPTRVYEENPNCAISGWGFMSGLDQDMPDVLQEAHIDVIRNFLCSIDWPTSILDTHICAFDEVGFDIGGCEGDYGGPLSCMIDGRYELAGVASFGRLLCDPTYPTVYTRITEYLSWIEEETGIKTGV